MKTNYFRFDNTYYEEIAICKSVLSGQTDAFKFLIARYQQRVYRLGWSFFKNSDDTEDFVQDVMIKAFLSLKSFRGDSLFSTWLMRIAYNMAVNSTKRKREYCSIAENTEFCSTAKTPEEQYIEQTAFATIRKAVNSLPEKYRVCVDLYFFYDMPYKDIASVTNLPINTIKSHVFRAKSILKENLECNEQDISPSLADFRRLLLEGAR